MNRSDRRFLEKLKSETRWAETEAATHRSMLRWHVMVADFIREVVRSHGIDPGRVRCLELGDKAAAELAAIPDTPELLSADDERLEAAEDDERDDGDDPRPALAAEHRRVIEYWLDRGGAPDFERDSALSVLGWCLAQHCAAAKARKAGGVAAADASAS